MPLLVTDIVTAPTAHLHVNSGQEASQQEGTEEKWKDGSWGNDILFKIFLTFNYVETRWYQMKPLITFSWSQLFRRSVVWVCHRQAKRQGRQVPSCPGNKAQGILLLCHATLLWPWVDTPLCQNLLYACPLLVSLPGLGNFIYLNLFWRQLLKARQGDM